MAKDINNCIFTARATRDCEVSQSGQTTVAHFTGAVDKGIREPKEGQATANFINFTAFNKLGEICGSYIKKGTKFSVVGHLDTSSYTNKEGQKVYTWTIVVDELQLLGGANNNAAPANTAPANTAPASSLPEDIDLPADWMDFN